MTMASIGMDGRIRRGVSVFERAASYLDEYRSVLVECGEGPEDVAELEMIVAYLRELQAERERIDARIRGHGT